MTVRVYSELLRPGDLPIYDFPDWKHDIFYLQEIEGKLHVMKYGGSGMRVAIPEIELHCTASTQDDAEKKVQALTMKTMAEICVHLNLGDTLIIMPIRSHMTLINQSSFLSEMITGLLFTHDPTPEDKHLPERRPAWVPERIFNIEAFLENTEKVMEVMEVMTE